MSASLSSDSVSSSDAKRCSKVSVPYRAVARSGGAKVSPGRGAAALLDEGASPSRGDTLVSHEGSRLPSTSTFHCFSCPDCWTCNTMPLLPLLAPPTTRTRSEKPHGPSSTATGVLAAEPAKLTPSHHVGLDPPANSTRHLVSGPLPATFRTTPLLPAHGPWVTVTASPERGISDCGRASSSAGATGLAPDAGSRPDTGFTESTHVAPAFAPLRKTRQRMSLPVPETLSTTPTLPANGPLVTSTEHPSATNMLASSAASAPPAATSCTGAPRCVESPAA
mmetsp:Transcript_11037/g.32725  ORF Transcript_11037/g.32725 Transcript_11037/m.32725 type:complete len:279 (+) Transcript_11037:107-943(+)